LDPAVSHKSESIAFPAISCGVYGYHPEDAAEISISVCKKSEYESVTKYFYLFSSEMVTIWTAAHFLTLPVSFDTVIYGI